MKKKKKIKLLNFVSPHPAKIKLLKLWELGLNKFKKSLLKSLKVESFPFKNEKKVLNLLNFFNVLNFVSPPPPLSSWLWGLQKKTFKKYLLLLFFSVFFLFSLFSFFLILFPFFQLFFSSSLFLLFFLSLFFFFLFFFFIFLFLFNLFSLLFCFFFLMFFFLSFLFSVFFLFFSLFKTFSLLDWVGDVPSLVGWEVSLPSWLPLSLVGRGRGSHSLCGWTVFPSFLVAPPPSLVVGPPSLVVWAVFPPLDGGEVKWWWWWGGREGGRGGEGVRSPSLLPVFSFGVEGRGGGCSSLLSPPSWLGGLSSSFWFDGLSAPFLVGRSPLPCWLGGTLPLHPLVLWGPPPLLFGAPTPSRLFGASLLPSWLAPILGWPVFPLPSWLGGLPPPFLVGKKSKRKRKKKEK